MATVTPWPVFRGRRVLAIAGGAAVLGLGGTAIGIAIDPRRALLGYLTAYVTVAAIAIGALILLLIGHAANARWPAPLRRVHESLTVVFPVLAVLFVPIAPGVTDLYVWASPSALSPHDRHLIELKSAWLDPAGFVIRSAIYLAVFAIAAEVLRRRSLRRDAAPPADADVAVARDRRFACAMLPLVGLATTFAAFDWVMSLQPTWVSSMFGIYYFAGGFGAGIALLAIIAWRARVAGITAGAITPHHFHALGRLLLAFVVFWTYAAYFQGFLIQIADRPSEVTFYIARTRHGWDVVLWAILILHFALPFALLLPRRVKLRPRYLAAVATIVLAGHVLDMYWLVVPSAGGPPLEIWWIDLAALVGVAGACVAAAAWRQRGVQAIAAGDPYLADGIQYASPT